VPQQHSIPTAPTTTPRSTLTRTIIGYLTHNKDLIVHRDHSSHPSLHREARVNFLSGFAVCSQRFSCRRGDRARSPHCCRGITYLDHRGHCDQLGGPQGGCPLFRWLIDSTTNTGVIFSTARFAVRNPRGCSSGTDQHTGYGDLPVRFSKPTGFRFGERGF